MDRINYVRGRRDRAQQLVRGGKSDESRRAINQIGVLEGWELARTQIRLRPPNISAHALKRACHLRRIKAGEHHRGLAAQQRAQCNAQGLVEHRQGRAQDDPFRRGTRKIRHRPARRCIHVCRVELPRIVVRRVRTHGVLQRLHRGGHAERAGNARGHALRNLRRGMRVQVGPTIGQTSVKTSHAGDVILFRHASTLPPDADERPLLYTPHLNLS